MDPRGFTLAAVTDDLGVEPRAREHADILEYRLDLATDPLARLQDYSGVLPILATNRVTAEGGEAPPGDARLDRLEAAIDLEPVVAVDIEANTLHTSRGTALARHARETGVTVIASTHDFETTPDRATLQDRLTRVAHTGDIGKVAVTATDLEDALTLLSVTHAATSAGDNVATIAMGDPGRHTRVVAPVYGSRIAYAPVDSDRATAPGQYDLATLAELLAAVR
ncbi:MAG: type I 3-dehydroquinate dehydratase [Halobacteriaceae archaeon]